MACKAMLSLEALSVFETGARYHMYHALAIGAGGVGAGARAAAARLPGRHRAVFRLALSAGSDRLAICGVVTPVGGLCFIAGWVLLAWASFQGPI